MLLDVAGIGYHLILDERMGPSNDIQCSKACYMARLAPAESGAGTRCS